MKHIVLLGLLLLSVTANAQERFRAGIIAGLAGTELAGYNPGKLTFRKAGIVGGGMVNARFNNRNSFQFEILYSQKGSQQKADTLANDTTFNRLALDYLEVPFIFRRNLKINVHKKNTNRLAFEIGPSVGFLSRIKSIDNGYPGYIEPGRFRKLELALHIGMSYTLLENFMFNVRYSNSIIPVIKNAQEINTFFRYTFYKGDNMGFEFTLRYLFGKADPIVEEKEKEAGE